MLPFLMSYYLIPAGSLGSLVYLKFNSHRITESEWSKIEIEHNFLWRIFLSVLVKWKLWDSFSADDINGDYKMQRSEIKHDRNACCFEK